MVSRSRRAVVLLAAVAMLAAAAREGRPDAGSSGLWSRLERIEAAFRSGDAGSLRGSCSGERKIRVEINGLSGGQGSYGAGQLQVVFSSIFDEVRTREFSFGRDDVQLSNPGTAFAKSRWVRRSQAGARDTVDMLTFTLREENGDWRVLEIRSSR
jgi:hypothetical protein